MKPSKTWLLERMTDWLLTEPVLDGKHWPLCDFDRLRFEIRPADVLLIEGKARISRVIQTVSRSVWTHSTLYIGHLHDIDDVNVRDQIVAYLPQNINKHEPLVLEALLGQGVVVNSLHDYSGYHLRICRPNGLAVTDINKVIAYAVERLGVGYDIRQLFDLARLMIPYTLLPRRWHSSLFERDAGNEVGTVCSTLIARAFGSVHFPILPQIDSKHQEPRIKPRNTRLFTPSDFDYSPYFDIIKYPYMQHTERCLYQQLPWSDGGDAC
ncbi:MAG: YiiX/YebB-like N1pC/P60 family cysteine hydrolase [Mariprofundaceae bacterium]|nr:YiiX/YebB-like N1pC/P60 family cysteine hydrolase [Mariprofundaceae bacterium]